MNINKILLTLVLAIVGIPLYNLQVAPVILHVGADAAMSVYDSAKTTDKVERN